MDYKLRKKVQNLRKNIFDEYINLAKSEREHENEFELIDFILATLLSFNTILPEVSDILQKTNEMCYYDFEELSKKKDIIYRQALNLKKEIIKKLGYNEKFLNSHENFKYDIDNNDDIDYIEILYLRTKVLLSNCSILKSLLSKHKYIKFENLEPLLKSLNNMYYEYNDIYSDYKESSDEYDEYESDDDYNSEYEYDSDIEDEIEDEMEDKWKNICNFNYDISLIDDLYCYAFGEINDEQRILIGLMISDFYEYHKCNEKMYTLPDNKDIIDTINYIENNTPDQIIQYFLTQPTWSCFIIDSYIYYNTNFSDEEKLNNRITIKNIGKLNILKNNNKFIDDTLKDETLYNSFITPLGELIRSLNYSTFYTVESIDNSQTDELFFKYFTSDFTLEVLNEDIPEELKDMDIKSLKSLQLRFIISDFFARKLAENNEYAEKLLNGDSNKIYKAIISDKNILKIILDNFKKELTREDEINLNDEQKKKIIKLNIFSKFDIS